MKWEDLKEDEEVETFLAKFVKYAPIMAAISLIIGGLFLIIIWYISMI